MPLAITVEPGVSSRNAIFLPPYDYAIRLIDLFETYMGHDYHWYLKTDLRTDLEKAYREPNSPAVREKLCKMLTIWALGASYSRYTQAYVPLVDSDHVSDSAPICPKCPGVEFFDQAMTFFKMPSEEPNIDHVEVMNLIVGLTTHYIDIDKAADDS